MKILVINAGSSSVKYQLFSFPEQQVLAKGIVEKIGLQGSFVDHYKGNQKVTITQTIPTHKEGLTVVFSLLTDKQQGVLPSLDEIQAIGHRVVHGGEYFKQATVLDEEKVQQIKACIPLAPLHNPANLEGIYACQELLPHVPQVAVFDTAFHQSMKPQHYLYALPYEYYEKYKIRRYGFHGTSHQYVYEKAQEIVGKKNLKAISCHIGNGASVCAIDAGNVVETSMGMTPLEGLMMGTRCGDIDPAIILFLMKTEGITPQAMEEILNKKSGLLGVSGLTMDMRDIIEAYKNNNEKAKVALEMYINRIVKYIGAYNALLNGADVLIWTAGVLERSAFVRKKIIEKLQRLGVTCDEEANEKCFNTQAQITTKDSRIPILVIPTNEELMIAKQTYNLIKTGN